MSDLIDRQIAISAICNACGKIDCDKMDKCEKLKLPPANSSEIPNSSDCISRQAAIDALGKRPLAWEQGEYEDGMIAKWESDVEAIKTLPSAEPERIKAHWVNGRCDKCNEHAPFWAMASTYHESNFCPNCGAEMRGEQNEH